MRFLFTASAITLLMASIVSTTASQAVEPFKIRVVDDVSGRGVPLVELTTVNNVRFVTDSAGLVAFDDASLMDQPVFFHVKSHGYEYPADKFGYHGRTIKIVAGGQATLKLKRINIAERVYRMTGGGIYRDSVMLDEPVPIEKPLLNAGVLGSDSVVNAVFQGRLHWFWGDTNLPKYPLGIFDVPGATSALPSDGGLDPAQGVNLEYFVDAEGYAKKTCAMEGKGPTWIDGVTALTDDAGHERLFAHYVKVTQSMVTHARGICEFDPASQAFTQVKLLELEGLHPTGHPVRVVDNGIEYVYFAHPFPYTRVRATIDAYLDPAQYEAYTCLEASDDPKSPNVIRGEDGRPEYAWRQGGLPFNQTLSKALIEQGKLTDDESIFLLHDHDSGDALRAHGGSLAWNEYRQRWVMIALETWGTTLLGEIWYAEAETPVGPWSDAVKIVTHDNYSFYNPKQHPYFDQDGGRFIYFEGTYTHTFTNNPDQTPRYDYNQIMYRLDLADERLGLDAQK
ncbi:MAG: hypothetical protein IT422_07530 [Pirellulaceae bacterium]|jgi:hypothetical protein|nr:hypothetical protein [Pirellulaceae bacterium]